VGDYDADFGLRRVKGKGEYEAAVALPEDRLRSRRVALDYLTPAECEQLRPTSQPSEPKEVRYLTPSPRANLAAPEAP
jgi:hypothetical protein